MRVDPPPLTETTAPSRLRWGVAVLWAGAALLATAALGLSGAKVGRWPEGMHLLGHLVLCGGAAVGVASATGGSAPRRAAWGVAAGIALGVTIELVQARVHPAWGEAGFDLAVDTLAAVAGALLWGGRREGPGHVASAVLHPLVVVPLGLWMAIGPAQTTLAVACMVPPALVWATGVHRHWWSDPDLSQRTQRGPLFLLGCIGMLAWYALADGAGRSVAGPAVLAAGVGTAVTVAGLKVSGHVAIPAVLGMWAWHHGELRAAQGFLGAALLLSWARWVARRHRRREVLAAWALGAATVAASVALQ